MWKKILLAATIAIIAAWAFLSFVSAAERLIIYCIEAAVT